MILIFKSLFSYLPDKNYRAMALWPFIILKDKDLKKDVVIINHEKIHLAQQIECLVLPFYIIYFSEYLYNRTKGNNHDTAYRNISFEKEAYHNQHDMNYLIQRKWWQNFRKC